MVRGGDARDHKNVAIPIKSDIFFAVSTKSEISDVDELDDVSPRSVRLRKNARAAANSIGRGEGGKESGSTDGEFRRFSVHWFAGIDDRLESIA